MKKLLLLLIAICLTTSCITVAKQGSLPVQKIKLYVTGVENVKVEGDNVVRKNMTVQNPEGELSRLSFVIGDSAYISLYSALTVGDVTNLWKDICVLENTSIRELHIFINSPGGDAFSGLALADQIERVKRKGFNVIGHASGIVASAALPVLTVCSKRIATAGAIFMVHETSIWKWPGRETASDIRSQNELMNLIRDRYFSKLIKYSNLTKEDLNKLEYKTTWFDAWQAKEWGLVDEIVGE